LAAKNSGNSHTRTGIVNSFAQQAFKHDRKGIAIGIAPFDIFKSRQRIVWKKTAAITEWELAKTSLGVY
jgi:hypothetical protein